MSEKKMPMEIWAWMGLQDNGSWDTEPCPCCPSVKYHHDDKYRALEAENKRLRDALSYCAQDPRTIAPQEQAQFMIARKALAVTPAPDSTEGEGR